MNALIMKSLNDSKIALESFMEDSEAISLVAKAADFMADALGSGCKILSCGNGGSMCDAMHFAEELSGRYREDRKALAAVAISDPSHISCAANDFGYDKVFSRYVEAHGKRGDVLLAISTSGNSSNVIKAAETANALGMKVVSLVGKTGRLKEISDICIAAPFLEYADRTQEIHIKIIHILIELIEFKLRAKGSLCDR